MYKAISSFVILFFATSPLFADMSLTGTGTVDVAPNAADIILAVVTEDTSVSKALSRNSVLANSVIKSLKNSGIEKTDIQTTAFTVSPKYVYKPNQEPKIVGFMVRHGLKVCVRDINEVGNIIDNAVASGTNRVDSVRFKVLDREKYVEQARVLAVADALKKASVYEKSSGIKLGKIKSLTEQRNYSRSLYNNMRSFEAGSSKIMPGEVGISITVTITWEIQ